MDDGPLKRLLLLLLVLSMLAGGLSPLATAPAAAAATGLDWTNAQGPGNGDATALAWDGTRSILYRATSGRGVWMYQGGTWTSLGGALNMAGVTTLAYDGAGNKLYAGTNGAGVWCYDPAGSTWTEVSTTYDRPSHLRGRA
jgi:hypothetical protein